MVTVACIASRKGPAQEHATGGGGAVKPLAQFFFWNFTFKKLRFGDTLSMFSSFFYPLIFVYSSVFIVIFLFQNWMIYPFSMMINTFTYVTMVRLNVGKSNESTRYDAYLEEG